jgi:hypothetical protein
LLGLLMNAGIEGQDDKLRRARRSGEVG